MRLFLIVIYILNCLDDYIFITLFLTLWNLHLAGFLFLFVTSVLTMMILLESILCIHFHFHVITKGGYMTPLLFHNQPGLLSICLPWSVMELEGFAVIRLHADGV